MPVQQLHAEIFHHLSFGTTEAAAAAADACDLLPACDASGEPLIAHALLSTAFQLEGLGEIRRSTDLYRRLLSELNAPEDMRANAGLRLGLLLESSGQLEAATSVLSEASAFSCAHGRDAARHCARMLSRRGFDAEASVIFAALVASWSGGEADRCLLAFDALACAARLRIAEDEPWTSVTDGLTGLSEYDATLASAWSACAFALEQNGFTQAARRHYEGLLEMTALPEDFTSNVRFRLGTVLEQAGDWSGALAQYGQSGMKQARQAAAGLLYLCEDYEAASQALGELISDPELTLDSRLQSTVRLGACHLRTGAWQKAIDVLEEARQQASRADSPQEVAALLLLGEASEAKRDYAAARLYYTNLASNGFAEPNVKAAALIRLRQLPKS